MSSNQRDDNYGRGSDRSVNRNDHGGFSITKTFHGNNGGNRYNNDNRGGNGGFYNNNRDRGGGNDNHRGGGNDNHRGGGNNNNNRFHQGGRGGGRGGADAPKKLPGNMMPRKEEAIPDQVQLAQQIMTRLSDFSAMSEEDDVYANIKALTNTIVTVGDLKQYPQEISDLFVKCFSQLSPQTPILACLLALIHTHEPEFSALVSEKLHTRYLSAVAQDEVVVAKLLLRALSCLSSAEVFEVEGEGGLVQVLQALLHLLTQELETQTDASKALQLSEAAQAGAYLLATTLVWAAPVLVAHSQETFLQTCAAALLAVKLRYVSAFAMGGLQAVFSTFSPVEAEDQEVQGTDRVLSVGPGVYAAAGEALLSDGSAWDSLWEAAVQALTVLGELTQAASSGTAYSTPAFMNGHWTALIAEGLLPGEGAKLTFGASWTADWAAHCAGLGAKAAHCHPSGACTTAIGSSASSTWLRLRINVFDNDSSPDAAAACKLSPLEKYAALTYLEDVFTFFDPVINEDGTKLGSMELLVTHLMAVSKLFAPDAHLEYLLIELLLQITLQQPVNPSLGTAVFRLVLELCRAAPQVYPPVVALGANTVFQLIPDLDSGSVLEFGRWFSFHLINTQLAWPAQYWDFWVGELQEAQEGGQHAIPLFLRFVVEKISYAAIPDKVRAALPAALHAYIPANAPANCALLQESGGVSILSHINGIAAEARHLRKLIEERADPEEVSDWLEECAPGASEGMEHFSASGEPFCWRGVLLLQVLLHVGAAAEAAALSVVVGLLDRYSECLLAQAQTEEQHMDLLTMLAEVFGSPAADSSVANGYMYHYLLDEMMRRGQIGVSAAARALTDAQSGEYRGSPCVYQCMESLLDRSTDFVRAAVAQRAVLGGGLVLDETLDLTPTAAPPEETATAVAEVAAGRPSVSGEEQVDYDEDMETEEREEGHRKRNRREDGAAPTDSTSAATTAGAAGAAGAADSMDTDASAAHAHSSSHEDQENPLWAAEEALKDALRNSRCVYSTVTTSLRREIVAGSNNSGGDTMQQEEEAGPSATVMACSLLRRTLRVFHGTERHLAHQQQLRVVVGAPAAQLHAYLAELSQQSGVDTSRWAAQIGGV